MLQHNGSMKRTMRAEEPSRLSHHNNRDINAPIVYTAHKSYKPSRHSGVSGHSGHTARSQRTSLEKSPNRSQRVTSPPIGRHSPKDSEANLQLAPQTSRKRDYFALTRAQKYRLRLKNHILAMVGEFVGTVLFLFFAYLGASVANVPDTSITGESATANVGGSSTVTATVQAPNTSSLQFIALSFGFSLTVNAWVFFRISGGLFNPAVSWALALVGVITPVRAVLLTISQFLGGITAAALIQAILPGPLYITTRLASNMSRTRGVFLEMFLTAMLMLAILLLAAEKSKTTFLAPVGIGLALFITQLGGVYWTGASVNPCRTLGPDVVIGSFPTYSWIYYVGPYLGATIAAGFYFVMKKAHYETVVPNQDADTDSPAANAEKRSDPAFAVDKVAGPGIADYSEQPMHGNLGADLTSARAHTKYQGSRPGQGMVPDAHQY